MARTQGVPHPFLVGSPPVSDCREYSRGGARSEQRGLLPALKVPPIGSRGCRLVRGAVAWRGGPGDFRFFTHHRGEASHLSERDGDTRSLVLLSIGILPNSRGYIFQRHRPAASKVLLQQRPRQPAFSSQLPTDICRAQPLTFRRQLDYSVLIEECRRRRMC